MKKSPKSAREQGSLPRRVVPRPAMASLDAQRRIVDIWMDYQGNDAKQILMAYRLGYNEGVKARHNEKLTDHHPE